MMAYQSTPLLTPAESMVILDADGADPREMLKLTFVDMFLKKVIETERISKKAGLFLKKTITLPCLKEGSNLPNVTLKPHEEILIQKEQLSKRLTVKEYLTYIYKKTLKGRMRSFKQIVLDELHDQGYLTKQKKKFLFVIPITQYELSDKGKQQKEEIEKILEDGEKNLSNWLKTDPSKAKSYLLFCGAHVLLLSGYDLQAFKELNKAIASITPQEGFYDSYFYYDDFDDDFDFESDFDAFDDLDDLDDFDSDFDGGDDGNGNGD